MLKPFKDRELYSFIEFALCQQQTGVERQKVHNELEAHVEESTAELARVNGEIKHEVKERQFAIEDLALLEGQLGQLTGGVAHDFNNYADDHHRL